MRRRKNKSRNWNQKHLKYNKLEKNEYYYEINIFKSNSLYILDFDRLYLFRHLLNNHPTFYFNVYICYFRQDGKIDVAAISLGYNYI